MDYETRKYVRITIALCIYAAVVITYVIGRRIPWF
jgi:hypothetical protein